MRVQHLKPSEPYEKKRPGRPLPKWVREAVANAAAEQVTTLSNELPEMACVEGSGENPKRRWDLDQCS